MYTHKLLVANPMIMDPTFSKSVVFLFKHGEEGAEGVILNSQPVGQVGFGEMKDLLKHSPSSLDEVKRLIDGGKMKSVPLFLGGPCRTPGIYFLHGYEEYYNLINQDEKPEFDLGIPASFGMGDDVPNEHKKRFFLAPGVYFGTPITFMHIVEDGKLAQGKFRFFTGQARWGNGQLEDEIEQGAWRVEELKPNLFFNQNALNALAGYSEQPTEKWSTLLGKLLQPSVN